MARTYTLKKRAENQAETRRRIVEAAVELHSSVGPARTTFSQLAERAAVQRNTLYAHFPDERTLLTACAELVKARDPLPDAAPWRRIEDRRERLRVGLQAIYGWYERNADLIACLLRDAQHHQPTQEVLARRLEPSFAAYRETLGAKLTAKSRAMLNLALGYHTWRSLVRHSGLKQAAAVTIMVHAVAAAKDA